MTLMKSPNVIPNFSANFADWSFVEQLSARNVFHSSAVVSFTGCPPASSVTVIFWVASFSAAFCRKLPALPVPSNTCTEASPA